MKRKIIVTTGTRADYGILRPLLTKISKDPKLELCLIVTGMHLSKKHGFTINEIRNDGFKIKAIVDMIPKGNSGFSMVKSLGLGIIEFSTTFKKIQPDINIVLGDRDEALASAIVSSHMNIPTAHIHGGDRTKAGIDEYNRHAITKLSNMHFAATKKSKERIIRMGEKEKFVFFTGSCSVDEIFENRITTKSELESKYAIKLSYSEIILLFHPLTTQISNMEYQITQTLNAIIKTKKPTIIIAPNSDPGNRIIFKKLKSYSQKYHFIKFFPTLPRSDYLGLLKYSGLLIGNSSSGIIEASCFNIPVINLGIRQDEREHGENVIHIKTFSSQKIHKEILHALNKKKLGMFSKSNIYGDGKASEKILKYIKTIPLTSELIEKKIDY
jgi:UDP-hydrolysing UDP-N-acetyl-D-glucosamine 2-epimerase